MRPGTFLHPPGRESPVWPGDRLLLASDGISECPDPQGNELGQAGLLDLLHKSRRLSSPDLLEALVWDLSTHSGGEDFPDDVSGIVFDYLGPG